MLEQLAYVYYKRGLILAKECRMWDAAKAVQQATILNPNDWKAWNVLGLCLYQLGDFAGARRAWDKSLARMPENNPALEYIQKLEDPNFITLLDRYNEALKYAQQEDYKKACAILLNKKKEQPEFVNYLNLLGLCLYGQGRNKTALDIWKKSYGLDKSHPDTQRYIVEAVGDHSLSSIIEFWIRLKNLFKKNRGRSEV